MAQKSALLLTPEHYNRSAMRRSLTPLCTLPALLAVLSGCGVKPEPTGAQAPLPRRVVDGAGRTVTISRPPLRVVSLDPGLTAWLFALGEGGRVVGRSGSETYPQAALKVPVVGADVASPGRVEAARPDLVVVPDSTSPAAARTLSGDVRAPVYVAGPQTIPGIQHDVLALAGLLGGADRGQRLVQRMRSQLATVQAEVRGQPRVPVFVDRGDGFTIPPNGIAASEIAAAGGRLARAAPRVYLASAGTTTLAQLRAAAATRRLPAIRAGRFDAVPPQSLTDTGPRVARTVRRLAALLHPGAVQG
jgi:iron complex transport system substrate-binding protein